MEAGDQQMQRYGAGWCRVCKMVTKHISTLNPKGFWVCTMCRSKSSKLNPVPRVKKIY